MPSLVTLAKTRLASGSLGPKVLSAAEETTFREVVITHTQFRRDRIKSDGVKVVCWLLCFFCVFLFKLLPLSCSFMADEFTR